MVHRIWKAPGKLERMKDILKIKNINYNKEREVTEELGAMLHQQGDEKFKLRNIYKVHMEIEMEGFRYKNSGKIGLETMESIGVSFTYIFIIYALGILICYILIFMKSY